VRASAIVLAIGLVAVPARALDSAPWDRVLSRHARGGSFDYVGLRADAEGRADLARFLEGAAAMGEDEPLAAWLDAYNASVVASILDHWPVTSVMAIPGFFDRERRRIAGRDRTLNEIENDVIRARFRDARIHVALVCGARSCPPLHPRAFGRTDLDATLERLTRAWLATDRALRIEGGTARASAIFGWYRADFEREAGTVHAWIRRHAQDRVLPDGPLGELPYDWSLNSPPDRARGP
jgi:hypothetical protein